MPRLTQEQKDQIISEYQSGKSVREIARETLKQESRESTIRAMLNREGIKEQKNDLIEVIEESMKDLELTKKVNRVSTPLPKLRDDLVKPVQSLVGGKTILTIADTQVKPNISLDYIVAVANYIASKQPDIIVCIGDFFDLPSLSLYDKGKMKFEGRRLVEDIKAGQEGLRIIKEAIDNVKGYEPEMHFCLGNHEHRIDRFVEDQPELGGMIGIHSLDIESYGWKVHPFLKPVEIEGILFCHYFPNEFTGRPLGGTANRMLGVIRKSFVAGHKQVLDIAISHEYGGKQQIGIVAGACYDHFEDYKGFIHNSHFRGLTVLHEVKDGFGLPLIVSLDYIKENYL